jgi:hypothetical protein
MQSTVVEAKKMEAARLALHPSYQQKLDPTTGNPERIRNLLHYYKNLRTWERGHATSVAPATGPARNNPRSQFQTRPQLPDRGELDWWDGLLSGVGDSDERKGSDRLDAVQNCNQGESGLGCSVGPPAS